MADGGEAQRLQGLLSQKERELQEYKAEAQNKIKDLESQQQQEERRRVSEVSQVLSERDALRTELDELKCRTQELKASLCRVEAEGDLKQKKLDSLEEALAKVDQEKEAEAARVADLLEETRLAAKIEGLEETREILQEFYPDMDLADVDKILSVSKGEMSFEEAFGSGSVEAEPVPAEEDIPTPVAAEDDEGGPGPRE